MQHHRRRARRARRRSPASTATTTRCGSSTATSCCACSTLPTPTRHRRAQRRLRRHRRERPHRAGRREQGRDRRRRRSRPRAPAHALRPPLLLAPARADRPAQRGRIAEGHDVPRGRSAARDVRRAPPARPGAVRVGEAGRRRRVREHLQPDLARGDRGHAAHGRDQPRPGVPAVVADVGRRDRGRARSARDPARRLRRAEHRGVRRVHRPGEVLRAARRRAVVHLRGLAPGVPGRRLQPRVPHPRRAADRASTGSTPGRR